MRLIACVVVLCAAGCDPGGCHGGGSGPPPDAAVDAPPGPAVTSVATVGGFTELRQGATPVLDDYADRIVITGSLLAGATSVTVGPHEAVIFSATDTELQVDLDVPHGEPLGAHAVVVHGPGWDATSPTQISITPIVVTPGGSLTGRGTYQSPASLCAIPTIRTAAYDDVVELAAGLHTCTEGIELVAGGGAEIRGAGVGATTVAPGFGGFSVWDAFLPPPNAPTRIRDISFQAPESVASVLTGSALILERLAITASAGYVVSAEGGTVTVTDVTYTGTGTPFLARAGLLAITNATVTGCATGVFMTTSAAVVLADSSITGCATALQVGDAASHANGDFLECSVTNTQLHGVTAVAIQRGHVQLAGVDARSSGAAGVVLREGSVVLSGGTRVEGAQLGVDASGNPDHVIRVEAHDAQLIGGVFGLRFWATDYGHVILRDAYLEGGSYGLELSQSEPQATVDLGTLAAPGNNQLVGAVFAFRVLGDPPFDPYAAIGTLLNGTSYAGQLLVGPASLAPDYQLVSVGSQIQF